MPPTSGCAAPGPRVPRRASLLDVLGAGRGPDDQLGRQQRPVRHRPAGDPVEQGRAGGDAEVVRRQANGRQWRIEERREGDVVEPDDGDVVGDAQAGLADRRDRAEGDDVAGDEDGLDRALGEELGHRPVAAAGVEGGVGDEPLVERRSRPPRARPGSRRAAAGRRCRPAGALVMQAIRRQPRPMRCSTARVRPADVVDVDARAVDPGQRALEDDREAIAGEPRPARRRRSAGRTRRCRRRAGRGAAPRTSPGPGRAARP